MKHALMEGSIPSTPIQCLQALSAQLNSFDSIHIFYRLKGPHMSFNGRFVTDLSTIFATQDLTPLDIFIFFIQSGEESMKGYNLTPPHYFKRCKKKAYIEYPAFFLLFIAYIKI